MWLLVSLSFVCIGLIFDFLECAEAENRNICLRYVAFENGFLHLNGKVQGSSGGDGAEDTDFDVMSDLKPRRVGARGKEKSPVPRESRHLEVKK